LPLILDKSGGNPVAPLSIYIPDLALVVIQTRVRPSNPSERSGLLQRSKAGGLSMLALTGLQLDPLQQNRTARA
jgi:hypothetical protein